MGRLTIKDAFGVIDCVADVHDCYDCEQCYHFKAMLEKLCHYEDLEEQGGLIEQKRGTWKIHDEYYFCSECYSEWKEMFTYCPCCGSKNGEAETDLLKELEGE